MENILQYKSDKGKLKVYNFYLKQKIVFCVLFQVYPLPLKSTNDMADRPITDEGVIKQIMDVMPTVSNTENGIYTSTLFKGTLIEKNVGDITDLNDLIVNGIYQISPSLANNVVNSWGLCITLGSNGYILQFVTSVNDCMLYVRTSSSNGNTWTNWKKMSSA